eukprot:scaffold4590_cov112-Cylindrotheca_fusiformis.AAC.3
MKEFELPVRSSSGSSNTSSWEESENFLSDPTAAAAFKWKVTSHHQNEEETATMPKEDLFQAAMARMNLEREMRLDRISLQTDGHADESLLNCFDNAEERRLLIQASPSFDLLDELLFSNTFVISETANNASSSTVIETKRREEEGDEILRLCQQTLCHQLSDLKKILLTSSAVPTSEGIDSATRDTEGLLQQEPDNTLDEEEKLLDSDYLKIYETLISALAQVPLRKMREAKHQHQLDEEDLLLADVDQNIRESEEEDHLSSEQWGEEIRLAELEWMMEEDDYIGEIGTTIANAEHPSNHQEATDKKHVVDKQQNSIEQWNTRRLSKRTTTGFSARKQKTTREPLEPRPSKEGGASSRKPKIGELLEPRCIANDNSSRQYSTTTKADFRRAVERGQFRADTASVDDISCIDDSSTEEEKLNVEQRETCVREAAFVALQMTRMRIRDLSAIEAAAVGRLKQESEDQYKRLLLSVD